MAKHDYKNKNVKLSDKQLEVLIKWVELIDEEILKLRHSKYALIGTYNITYSNYCIRRLAYERRMQEA